MTLSDQAQMLARYYQLQEEDQPLRDDVRLLGSLLGETIRQQHGETLFNLVEEIRQLAKQARQESSDETRLLAQRLAALPSDKMVILSRAFALFLNLANLAEQHHQIRRRRQIAAQNDLENLDKDRTGSFLEVELGKLKESGVDSDRLHAAAADLSIDLVLTAHPTEIVRRSVLAKFLRINRLLAEQDRIDLSSLERKQIRLALHRTITEVWETDEIRRRKPTPVDEAKNGLIAVEQTLWHVVPTVLRRFDHALLEATGKRLPMDATPIHFGSWMGGDRDGNPNTTPAITREVCQLSRLRAAELFFESIDTLRKQLSMKSCNEELRRAVGADVEEPYRELLQTVRKRLRNTIRFTRRAMRKGEQRQDVLSPKSRGELYLRREELREPLMLCYRSLADCGNQMIADGLLTDILRRLDAFGLVLLKLDIRQEAGLHSDVIDTITRYLGIGNYLEWDEEQRQAFLIQELESHRPLISSRFPAPDEASDEVREVLQTFRMLAAENPESLGTYVISMASRPSHVLEVALLQKECRVARPMPIAPLFEKLDDLSGAADCVDRLLSIDWYRSYSNGRQEIMIGYSDSAKDAGKLAAAWGLYQAQEKLVEVCERHDTRLILFHGRGGTVARGGGPAYEAILSQPPGSVNGSLRVTEQGEVIQAKYGLPGMAIETLETYLGAVLEATVAPPPRPLAEWRQQMAQLADTARDEFHRVVRHHPDFVDYFRQATPEQELGALNIGSRPSHRKPDGGIESLRAIPWIFAWTQTRLMLPAWLGVGAALREALDDDKLTLLQTMREGWPFFRATLDAIEMVFSKADPGVSARYDSQLVDDRLQPLGETLRSAARDTMALTLQVTGHTVPLQNQPVVRRSVEVRNTYVDPLNLLQVELLSRVRSGNDPASRDALLVAINGIAAGMRNTG